MKPNKAYVFFGYEKNKKKRFFLILVLFSSTFVTFEEIKAYEDE